MAALFFFGTSAMPYYAHNDGYVKWLSPDETANYIFSKLYGQEGIISFEEKYNLYTQDIMHPRSFRSDHGMLKPVSFLGIILVYGKIVSVFGYEVLPYLTPAFASAGIFFFYLLVKEIFGRINAVISAALLAIFPVYIYYTARSMFHNVLFTVFLIIGFYFAYLMGSKKKTTTILQDIKVFFLLKSWYKFDFKGAGAAVLSGIFIGLAVITRTSELIWLGPVLVFLWLANARRLGLFKPIIFASCLFLAVLPAMYYNQLLYGSFYNGGYPEMNSSIHVLSGSGAAIIGSGIRGNLEIAKEMSVRIFETVFHFGFHPRQSLGLINSYFPGMFAWLFYPAVLGFLLFMQKAVKHKTRHWVFLFSYVILSAILVFYYGSWKFHDNPDPESVTIGNSYTRYWLPVYLGAIPFASLFIMRLSRALCAFAGDKPAEKFLSLKIEKSFYIKAVRSVIIILVAAQSVNFVLAGSDEGLIFQAKQQRESESEWREIIDLTERNSVIITRYHDKIFFPERKVIVGLFDDPNMIRQYANIARRLPVYYYNFTLPRETMDYLNERRLKEAGLGIEAVRHVRGDFTLYKLYLLP